jgi:6-phosphogluconolactonase (cycloisomerase 2 family)
LTGERGPHVQQDGSHPHQVVFDLEGRIAFVPDKGLDCVFAIALNDAAGTLEIAAVSRMPQGSGPRHMVFHPHGHLAYVVGELDRTLLTVSRDGAQLQPRSSVSTVPGGVCEGSAAGIVLSRAQNALYVSNRGHDSVAVFPLEDAGLGPAGWVPAGRTPRFICEPEAGGGLFVAREEGHSIARLAPDSSFIDVTRTESPVCIAFRKVNP